MDYLLMTLAIVFASANSVILRIFKNRSFQTPGDVFYFNGGVSLLWALLLLPPLLATGTSLSAEVLLYGTVYAVILFLFLYFKTQALATGPVALTTLMGSAAFLIPTLYGVLIPKESINDLQILGMALILFSLVLCVAPKKKSEPLSLKWFLYSLGFLVAGGLLGIFYKIFGASPVGDQVDGMMLSASVISALFFFLFGLLTNRAKKYPPPTIAKSALFYLLSSGIVGCVYIRMNISLSAVIPSAIFFPVSNGSLMLLSTVAGYAIFKEKLSGRQILGLALGLIAVVVTGCAQAIVSLFQ